MNPNDVQSYLTECDQISAAGQAKTDSDQASQKSKDGAGAQQGAQNAKVLYQAGLVLSALGKTDLAGSLFTEADGQRTAARALVGDVMSPPVAAPPAGA